MAVDLLHPSLKASILKISISDHCPLLVQSLNKNGGPRPFRFINCWLTHPRCLKNLKEAWAQSQSLHLVDKIKTVKHNLKAWNRLEFGIIDDNIYKLEDKIHGYDMCANDGMLDSQEFNDRKSAQLDLWQWYMHKEEYWPQNSRAKWLREGDKNTCYFHTIDFIRRRKNNIELVDSEGGLIDSPDELKKEAVSLFSKIFKEDHQVRPTFENREFKQPNSSQVETLTSPFTHDEINNAVASCDSSKAPGPNGFNFKFVKSAWEVVKWDFYDIVAEFQLNSRLPRGCNNDFIGLIPKIDSPHGFKDYRPISMVGCVYK